MLLGGATLGRLSEYDRLRISLLDEKWDDTSLL